MTQHNDAAPHTPARVVEWTSKDPSKTAVSLRADLKEAAAEHAEEITGCTKKFGDRLAEIPKNPPPFPTWKGSLPSAAETQIEAGYTLAAGTRTNIEAATTMIDAATEELKTAAQEA